MTKFCSNCGTTLGDQDIFCNECGTRVGVQKQTNNVNTGFSSPTMNYNQGYTSNQQTSVKKFYRSRNDRWITGVCGGLGKYFNIDSTLIRIGFIIFGLIYGSGLLAYILLAILVPEEPPQQYNQ